MHIVSILFALLVLMGSAPAVALPAQPAASRCDSCNHIVRVQQLDCNALAQVNQFGGCSGFCRNFAQAWGGASEATIAQCVNNCNTQLARCAGGGGGGGGQQGQPNCQWYQKGDIRKYICRVY